MNDMPNEKIASCRCGSTDLDTEADTMVDEAKADRTDSGQGGDVGAPVVRAERLKAERRVGAKSNFRAAPPVN